MNGIPQAPILSAVPFIHIGPLALPSYYFVISLSTCLCILWMYRRTVTLGLSQKSALDGAIFALIGGFIGARLAHVIFEEPSYYIEAPLRILMFWQGGFVFFGGLALGYLSGLFYFVKAGDNGRDTYSGPHLLLRWHDLVAPIIALGYGLGRIGCFLEGCCYGKVCDLPWATPVQYQLADRVLTLMQHPTQLYAVTWELGAVVLLLGLEKKRQLAVGNLFFIWLGLHGAGRILMEIFRADPRGPQVGFLSLSMGFSIFLLVVSGLFLVSVGDKLRKR